MFEQTPLGDFEGTNNELPSENKLEASFIKCDRCGGNMTFDPQTQGLKCAHCGAVESFEKNTRVCEQDIEKGFDEAESWQDEAKLFRCENCGAQVVLKNGEVAASCPFCGTPHVVESEELPGIKPTAVYPFVFTEPQAAEKAKKWAKSKLFAPKGFKKDLQSEHMRGVFLPCFTFDSDTFSKYNGRLGERRTRTVKTNKGTRTETYIRWYNVSGTFSKLFDDVFISCGNMPQSELEKLLPYRIETLCTYEQKFLSGYAASHYSKDLKECWKDAKKAMDEELRKLILAKYHCTEVDYLNVSTVHGSVTFKYVLLPVYRINYLYRKKEYPVLVNGNTGKVSGKTPTSPWRVLTAVLICIALFVAFIFAASAFDSCGGDSDIDDYDDDYYYFYDIGYSAADKLDDFTFLTVKNG